MRTWGIPMTMIVSQDSTALITPLFGADICVCSCSYAVDGCASLNELVAPPLSPPASARSTRVREYVRAGARTRRKCARRLCRVAGAPVAAWPFRLLERPHSEGYSALQREVAPVSCSGPRSTPCEDARQHIRVRGTPCEGCAFRHF
jgi:hypothetical protein